MNAPESQWTAVHSTAASKEGWDIFDVDGAGYFEIQKIDEANRFASDEEAVRFVGQRAAAASRTNTSHHFVALSIHRWYVENRKRPEVGKLFKVDARKH